MVTFQKGRNFHANIELGVDDQNAHLWAVLLCLYWWMCCYIWSFSILRCSAPQHRQSAHSHWSHKWEDWTRYSQNPEKGIPKRLLRLHCTFCGLLELARCHEVPCTWELYDEKRNDNTFTRCHLCTPAPCKCLSLRVDYSTCKLQLEFASTQDRAICASFSLEWNLFSAKFTQITTKLNRAWHKTL